MNKKQIEALVNKGAITHVGIAADLEKLSDKEICERYVTKHEVTTELLSGEDETPIVPEEPAIDTVGVGASVPETPVVEEPTPATPTVEEAAPVTLSEEPAAETAPIEEVAPVEEVTTTKKTSKKSKRVAEEVTEAPVVDPVTE